MITVRRARNCGLDVFQVIAYSVVVAAYASEQQARNHARALYNKIMQGLK